MLNSSLFKNDCTYTVIYHYLEILCKVYCYLVIQLTISLWNYISTHCLLSLQVYMLKLEDN